MLVFKLATLPGKSESSSSLRPSTNEQCRAQLWLLVARSLQARRNSHAIHDHYPRLQGYYIINHQDVKIQQSHHHYQSLPYIKPHLQQLSSWLHLGTVFQLPGHPAATSPKSKTAVGATAAALVAESRVAGARRSCRNRASLGWFNS